MWPDGTIVVASPSAFGLVKSPDKKKTSATTILMQTANLEITTLLDVAKRLIVEIDHYWFRHTTQPIKSVPFIRLAKSPIARSLARILVRLREINLFPGRTGSGDHFQ